MNYQLALVFIFGGLGLTALSIYFYFGLKRQENMQKLKMMNFKQEYRDILLKIEHYQNLTQIDKDKIEHLIIEFSYDKEFIGIDLEVTHEMKVIISFYASLLLLHLKDYTYLNLKTIIIYPTAVLIDRVNISGGIYSKDKFLIDGQSSNDTVVIIWDDAKKEAYHPRHENLIVHEFAHEIDFLDGEIDGVPPIEKSKYNEWANTIFKDFDELQDLLHKHKSLGKYKLIGDYAGTNKAEFFAVVSERFFEAPHNLKKKFPELYDELKTFYHMDTIQLRSQE